MQCWKYCANYEHSDSKPTTSSATAAAPAPAATTSLSAPNSTSTIGGAEVNTTNIKATDDCKDNSLYQSPVNNFQFLMQCNTEYDLYNQITDIFTVSLALCMDACSASHATAGNPDAKSCNRVVYQPNVTAGTGGEPNCYLLSKNNTQGIGGSATYDTAIADLNGGGSKRSRLRRSFMISWF